MLYPTAGNNAHCHCVNSDPENRTGGVQGGFIRDSDIYLSVLLMIDHQLSGIFIEGVGGCGSGPCKSDPPPSSSPLPVVGEWSGSALTENCLSASPRLSSCVQSVSQPLSLSLSRSPSPPSPSCSLARSLSRGESIGLSVDRFWGKEAKHRQVLTSGQALRCRLMTMMMVRMMHLFPCLYEFHRIA